MVLSIPQILIKQGLTFTKNIIGSKDLGFKLARIGAGAAVVGAGAGVGLNLVSDSVNTVSEKTSDVFGIPKNILLIVGAALIFIVLLASK